MPAGRAKLTIDQGSTWRAILTAKGSDRVPIDLTGYTARMQVRPSIPSATVLANLTTENGGIEIEPLAGEITLMLTDEQTAALPSGTWVYDLELVSAGGEVTRTIEGGFVVRPEVTR